jgi:cell division protein FtsQ
VSAIARMLPRPSIRRLAPPRPRTLLVLVLVLALLGVAWLWVRDSPLVSVDRVTVTGLSGPSSGQVQSALVNAARSMTTLDVNMSALRTAVAPYPVVKNLIVTTQFPHGMRIRVSEQIPVGAVTVGARKIAVAADGTLLPSVSAAGLASIPVSVPPGGTRLTDGATQGAVAVLAAAPGWLRVRVTEVSSTTAHGLVAAMRNGPEIYFGGAGELRAKWMAVAAVLADPSSQGAAYIDVTVPSRPAAAGVAGAATADQGAFVGTTPTGTAAPGTPTTSGSAPASATGAAGGTATTPVTPTGG